jgi:hypothetical protein
VARGALDADSHLYRGMVNGNFATTFPMKVTPELLERMTSDQWLDGGAHFGSSGEATWPIHDRVLGLQRGAGDL